MKALTSLLLLLFSIQVLAQETPSDELLDAAEAETLDVGEAQLDPGDEWVDPDEDSVDLGEYTVTGERFTFEQETALRMVRQALKRSKSSKREDWATWVCWYRKPVGKHRTYLECARNGDLVALRPNLLTAQDITSGRYLGGSGAPGGDYGTIMRSNRPVNKKQFEAMLSDLPGSDEFDQEFVARSLAGQRPPRDVPTDAELDSFAAAYQSVGELENSGADEDAMVAAIEAQGLSIARYNRLVDLVETYQSIENEVATRLGTWERPDS